MTTQKDIAVACGVSISAVSRALAGKAGAAGIPEETAQRVIQAAVAMGYVPNETARILKGAATRTLGVAVADFEDPYLGPMIGQLQRLANERGYTLVLEALSEITAMVKHAIDGLIIAGSCEDLDWARAILERGIPAVCIGHSPEPERVPSIAIDERKGLELIIAHLRERGHHRIGFVGGTGPVHRRRESMVRELLGELPPEWIGRSSSKAGDAGYEAMHDLLKQAGSDRPSAVIAASDLRAAGAIRAAVDAGLHLPAELAITGFDDIPLSALTVPSLTTIRQPVLEMTRLAFNAATGEADPAGSFSLEATLIIRESTSS